MVKFTECTSVELYTLSSGVTVNPVGAEVASVVVAVAAAPTLPLDGSVTVTL